LIETSENIFWICELWAYHSDAE